MKANKIRRRIIGKRTGLSNYLRCFGIMFDAILVMRFLGFILLILMAAIYSCTKDNDGDMSPENPESEIIGIDSRLCACCGGWWLLVNSDSARALFFPGNFADSINVNELPMKVIMTWDKNGVPDCLGENLIHVISIRKK